MAKKVTTNKFLNEEFYSLYTADGGVSFQAAVIDSEGIGYALINIDQTCYLTVVLDEVELLDAASLDYNLRRAMKDEGVQGYFNIEGCLTLLYFGAERAFNTHILQELVNRDLLKPDSLAHISHYLDDIQNTYFQLVVE